MYNKRFNGGPSKSFSRPHSRPHGSFNGPRHFGKKPRVGQYIDPKKFINKAVSATESVAVIPTHSFQDFQIENQLKEVIVKKGYISPTPIQDKAIPLVLKGLDVVGIADTGTGKTAAFLIPLVNKVLMNRKEQILIVVPTRELATQINDELKAFTTGMKIFSVVCVGGMHIGAQIRELRFHNNFIIGTPGRLKDLINKNMIKPAEFKTLVLDEADRMLDMGFVHEIRALVAAMPKDRHTLFFSATISPEIEKLIHEFLKNPERVLVKTRDTSKNVDQDVVRVAGANKFDALHAMLSKDEFIKVLIFGRTKHGVEKLSKVLAQKGHKAGSIHGNKTQSHRQKVLDQFKGNHIDVLVATDVAARGLDIPDVSHVINYDLPATYEDYVHRIGRTGRGNKQGKALTFIE